MMITEFKSRSEMMITEFKSRSEMMKDYRVLIKIRYDEGLQSLNEDQR